MALRITSGGLKSNEKASGLKIISGGLKAGPPVTVLPQPPNPPAERQPAQRLTIKSGGLKPEIKFDGRNKLDGLDLVGKSVDNAAKLMRPSATDLMTPSLLPAKLATEAAGQVVGRFTGGVRGAISAKNPVLTKKGDLDIPETAAKNFIKGIITPEAFESFGGQIQDAYPATNPYVSGAAGTALDLGILHMLGKAIPLEGKSLEQVVREQLKTAVESSKGSRIQAIREKSKGLDFKKEIDGVIVEIKQRNPNISEAEIGGLKNKLGAFVGKVARDITKGEPTTVSERIFRPGGLKEFVLGEAKPGGIVPGSVPGTGPRGEMLPAAPKAEVTIGPGGGVFRGKAVQPKVEPGAGGPLVRAADAPKPLEAAIPPMLKVPVLPPSKTGSNAKLRAKAKAKNLAQHIRSVYGGIDPSSVKDYNVRNDFQGFGLTHILKKGGAPLARVAADMVADGDLIVQEGQDPQEALMEALKKKAPRASDQERFIEQKQEDELRRREEEAMAPYLDLVNELAVAGYNPDEIRALIKGEIKKTEDVETGEDLPPGAADFNPEEFNEPSMPTEKQSMIPGTEARFPSGPIRPADKNLIQEKGKEGELFQERDAKAEEPFFSQLERVIEEKMPNSASAEQVRGILNNSGVKQEEMEWLDIDGFLAGKEKVSKQEILDHVRSNNVQVEEVVKGGRKASLEKKAYQLKPGDEIEYMDETFKVERIDDDGPQVVIYFESGEDFTSPRNDKFSIVGDKVRGTKFESYQLPGGENYKELLLTLPTEKSINMDDAGIKDINRALHRSGYSELNEEQEKILRSGGAEAKEMLDDFDSRLGLRIDKHKATITDSGKAFLSTHFDEPNVLAHVHFNERTDAEGKKVLFIEEIQSDWHQKGRKEGYTSDKKLPDNWTIFETKGPSKSYQIRDENNRMVAGGFDSREQALKDFFEDPFFREARGEIGKVPNAPFKKTWHELALKRMLRYAVENGFDKIAWTTGEQQAERYDLWKQVDNVEYEKDRLTNELTVAVNKDGKRIDVKKFPLDSGQNALADYVGKDLAKHIYESTAISGNLEGEDLKVGGKGMKGFYDQIIPSFLNKYTKKWGGRVATTHIVRDPDTMSSKELLEDEGDTLDIEVHSLEITHSMKEAVLGGQPLFREKGQGESTFEVESAKVKSLLEKHGIRDVVIKLVNEIQTPSGAGAHGSYTPAQKLVKLTARPAKSTGYHEAFHMLIRETGFMGRAEELFTEVQNITLDKGDLISQKDAEEWMADEFAKFAGGKDDPKWTSRIKEFFKDLWEAIKKLLGREDIARALFKDLYEGKGPKKFDGKAPAREPSLFQEKQERFPFEPAEGSRMASKLSRRAGYSTEQSEKIIALAKEKGLIMPNKDTRLFGILRHYKGATFDELKTYIEALTGNKDNPPRIFKLFNDIKKDAEAMKSLQGISDNWSDINKAEMLTLDPVRIIEKVTGEDIWDSILGDNTFQVMAGADAAMFSRLEKEIAELDTNREGIKKGSKEDRALMVKYENSVTDPDIKFTESEGRVIRFLRRKLDSLIVEANEMRRILGKNQIPYRKNYLPHLSEQNVLMEFMKENRGESIPDISNEQWEAMRKGDFTKGNMPFNRFALKRRGMFSDKLAAVGNYEYYLKTILREIYMGPAITHARKFIEYAVLKQPNAYKALDRWLNDIKGKPSLLDQSVAGLIASQPAVRRMRSLLAKSALFGNLNFYAMNASNFAIAYDELGHYLNKGIIKFLSDKEFRDFAFKNSVMLRGRSVDPDLDPSKFKTLEMALNEVTVLLEYNNVGSAWAGAYLKATEDLGYGKEKAIRFADAIARRTQTGYKTYEVNAIMRSNSGKMLAQFQTWSFNAMNHILYDLGVANIPKNILRSVLPTEKFTGKAPKKKNVRWGAFYKLLAVAIIFNSIYRALGLREPYDIGAAVPTIPETPKLGKGKFGQPPLYQMVSDVGTVFTGKKAETKAKAAGRVGLGFIPTGRQIGRFMEGRVMPKNPNEKKEEKKTIKFNPRFKPSFNSFSGKF